MKIVLGANSDEWIAYRDKGLAAVDALKLRIRSLKDGYGDLSVEQRKVTIDNDNYTQSLDRGTLAAERAKLATLGQVAALNSASNAYRQANESASSIGQTSTFATIGGGTFTFPAGTGKWTVTAASTLGVGSADGGITATIGGTTGTAAVAFLFIDDDPTANTLVTEHKITTAATTGASETTTKYNTWLYDSTDMFIISSDDDDIAALAAVTAASEAQVEAAMAGINDLTSHMTITYRKTSVVTSGISLITVGT
jgi:hypothetical protein